MSLLLALSGGPDVTVTLTGVSGIGSVGNILPQLTVNISGVTGVGIVGILGIQISADLSNVSASGSVGTMTADTGVVIVVVDYIILARRRERR